MAQALLSIQILPRTKSGDDSVYPYVDKAIDIIKASGVSKFGFVGNERYRSFS